jgi:putative heme-binding domain-containing protein
MMPLDGDAIDRDPLLAAPDAIHDVGLAAEQSKVVSAADAWTTSNLHAGQFSAACGVFAPGAVDSEGEWLLVCEPTSYVVQRQRLQRSGSVWKSEREPQEQEFLASLDTWFRAVDVTSGPGRSVYIVDMARAVIEHPDFMPPELQTRPDLRDGTHLGRIWRVREVGDPAPLEKLDAVARAVAWLSADSPWKREMAGQFFLEHPTAGTAELAELIVDPNASSRARARAGYALQRRNRLSSQQLRQLLGDDEPRLRTLAVEWSNGHAPMFETVLALADDRDPLVLRATARWAASGEDRIPERAAALVKIAASDDPWIARTVASAADGLVPEVTRGLVHTDSPSVSLLSHLTQRLTIADPAAGGQIVAQFVSSQSDLGDDQIRLLEAWMAGVRTSGGSVTKSLEALPIAEKQTLDDAFHRAAALAIDWNAPAPLRARCLQIAFEVGRLPADLRPLIADQSPPQVRVVAIPVLLRRDREWTYDYLREHLLGMTIQLRNATIAACLRDVTDVKWLMTEISGGTFPKTMIDPATAKQLREHSDNEIRSEANRLFQSDPNRAKVLADYASSVQHLGEPIAGKKLFAEHCSACHRIGDIGTNVGPDISDTRIKTAEALLTSILDPNAAIDSSFIQYKALTQDGRVLDGLLIDETSEAITLQQKGGERITIGRQDIETVQAPGVSLMPEGFEQAINPAAMADLLSYLKNWRYLETAIPGTLSNRPE